jgi:hypothetical protein
MQRCSRSVKHVNTTWEIIGDVCMCILCFSVGTLMMETRECLNPDLSVETVMETREGLNPDLLVGMEDNSIEKESQCSRPDYNHSEMLRLSNRYTNSYS